MSKVLPVSDASFLGSASVSAPAVAPPPPSAGPVRPGGDAPAPAGRPALALPLPGPGPRRSRWPVFVAALLAALYLGTTSGPAVFDLIEGLYAGAAREMLDRDYVGGTQGELWRGHWWVPTNDGVPRLQKPPFLYWLEMLSLRAFGLSEFAVRLPIALACLVWFFALFLLGRRLYGTTVGATAALLLGTMAGTFIFGHMIMPEPLLAACLTLTFWCFASACRAPEKAGGWLTLAWLFMALGSFSKGLHGAGYPLAVAAILAWWHPASRPVWKKLLRPAGLLIFVAILAPWYAAMEIHFPGFLRDQFLNEQVGHVINRRFPADSERVSTVAFWAQHLVYFFPWVLFAPAAVIFWLRRRRKARGVRLADGLDVPAGSGETFPLRRVATSILPVWLGLTAGSIVFSALQDYYTMTAWGVVALWLALPLAAGHTAPNAAAAPPRWTLLFAGTVVLVLGLAAVGAGWWLSARVHAAPAGAEALAATNTIADRDSILDTITAIPLEAWRQLLPLLWGTAAALGLGGALAIAAVWRGRPGVVVPAVAVASAFLLACAARGMGVMEDQVSLKRVAQAINRLAEPAALVVCQGNPRDNPSAFFYIDRQLHYVDSSPIHEFASRELRIGTHLFLEEDELARRWNEPGGRQVFLICEAADLPRWERVLALTPAQSEPRARSGSRVLLVNH